MGLDLVSTDIYEDDYLKHHGILGMKWGIRRFQNPDGTLTLEGKQRYLNNSGKKDYSEEDYQNELSINTGKNGVKSDAFYEYQYKFFDDSFNDAYGHRFSDSEKKKQIKEWKLHDKLLGKLDPNHEYSSGENYRDDGKDWEHDGKHYNSVSNIVSSIIGPHDFSRETTDPYVIENYSWIPYDNIDRARNKLDAYLENEEIRLMDMEDMYRKGQLSDKHYKMIKDYSTKKINDLRDIDKNFDSYFKNNKWNHDGKEYGRFEDFNNSFIHSDEIFNDFLKHHGILGMHWGIRRFQNPDGTLTPEGRIRYGVNTAAETKKLSYSSDYMALKAKKDRTPKEEEKLKRLENGKKHFDKSVKDPNYWERMKDNTVNSKLSYNAECYMEYFNSTNYGKGMNASRAMMAIPTTLIGGAADVGAIYMQAKLGSPIIVGGAGLIAGYGIGDNLGAEAYAKKNKELLEKEYGVNSNKNTNERFPYKVTSKDLLPGEDETLSAFGLKPSDLAMDHDGYVVRKDGKNFEFTYNGKTHSTEYLEDAHNDHMWGMTPVKSK